jgi:predicted MFS family arabinose efflux permease
MTGVLALLAIGVIKWLVPEPEKSSFHSDAEAKPARLPDVLKDKQLLRLNYGIFALHAAQMAMFIVVPVAINQTSGLAADLHWKIYLPILVFSFILMIPAIIVGEKQGKLKPVFVAAVAAMLAAQTLFALKIDEFLGIVVALGVYFIAFNVLEASLPSIVSKIAPPAAKGTAMGVYNTCQSLGVFAGGVAGGYLVQYHGAPAAFIFCGVLMLVWLVLAITMSRPPAVKSKMQHLSDAHLANLDQLRIKLNALAGVREVAILPEERLLLLKVDLQADWDESAFQNVMGE